MSLLTTGTFNSICQTIKHINPVLYGEAKEQIYLKNVFKPNVVNLLHGRGRDRKTSKPHELQPGS